MPEIFYVMEKKDATFTQKLTGIGYNFFHTRPERCVKMTKTVNKLIVSGKLLEVKHYEATQEQCAWILDRYYTDEAGNCTADRQWKAKFVEYGLIKEEVQEVKGKKIEDADISSESDSDEEVILEPVRTSSRPSRVKR